jgi:hypothetical protein
MRYGVRALIGLVVSATLVATACSDTTSPVAPVAPSLEQTAAAPANGLLDGLLGTVTKSLTSLLCKPVTRNTPLANDVSWTFKAGPLGGATSNSTVGLSVVVPPGALTAPVTIEVTALKGSAVAYRFEPHLEFDRMVVLTQNLRGTSVGGLLSLPVLCGAHFKGDAPEYNSRGWAIVTEVVSTLTSLLTKTTSFGVSHFSGWIVVSGCE